MPSSHSITARHPRAVTGRRDGAAARRRRAMRLLLMFPLFWSAAAVAQDADLAITKDDGSATYVPGGGVSYQIVVSNAGPDPVLDAVVADPLPAGIAVGTWTCTVTGAASCDQAAGLGISVERLRLLTLVRVSLLSALAVSFAGSIGFIGLVGPHLARLALGEDHRFYLPGSALAGALVLSLASIAGKMIVPGVVVPIGIVTALVGIPLLIALLIGQRRTA